MINIKSQMTNGKPPFSPEAAAFVARPFISIFPPRRPPIRGSGFRLSLDCSEQFSSPCAQIAQSRGARPLRQLIFFAQSLLNRRLILFNVHF
jgi:hypothetical protein